MAVIKIEDDCLAPDLQIVLRYKGPNPYGAYPKIKKLMREIWEVESISFWEREFRWDATDGGFLIKCYIERGIDKYTRVLIEVFLQGSQPSDPNGEGNLEIRIGGYLTSTFGGSSIIDDAKNPLFRLMFWIYYRYFYKNQRSKYLNDWCINRIQKLKTSIQKILNILPPQSTMQ
ncbi:MAG: hypothetical protein QXO84_00190 [Candidatus Aenigmatarchaeota archaeon]